jgi:exodeoxyribonuclease VII large subunit
MRLTPDRAALLHQITALQRRLSTDVTKRVRFEQERVRGLARHALFSDPGSLVSRARRAVEVVEARLSGVALARMARARERVLRLEARLERRRPAAVHAATMARVESLASRLGHAMRARLDRRTLESREDRLTRAGGLAIRETRSRLESAHRQLLAVGPQGVLERGFSCTMTEDGRALRSASEARAGERLRTRLAKGEVRSIVEGGGTSTPPLPPSTPARTSRPRKLARPAHDPDQQGLFGE